MPPETLEFEEPIAVLLKEIEALELLPHTDPRDREIASLRRRIESVRGELYRSLTPWQRVQVARHPNRPGLEDFVKRLFTNFVELHRDRRYVGDRVLMQEFAIYSVIPPEGCAAILWRDPAKKIDAAEALKLTAPDLLKAGIVDEIIPEPIGGAQTDPVAAARLVDNVLVRVLGEVRTITGDRLAQRYEKFRNMGKG